MRASRLMKVSTGLPPPSRFDCADGDPQFGVQLSREKECDGGISRDSLGTAQSPLALDEAKKHVSLI